MPSPLDSSLHGPWALRPVDAFAEAYPEEGWHAQELPAHWQQHPALAKHVGKAVYRKRFSLPAGQALEGRVFLRVPGAFYKHRVRLNGALLGEGEGYFVAHEHEATGKLQAENELIIEVDCPAEGKILEKTMILGVFAHWDAMSHHAHNPGGLWLMPHWVVKGPLHVDRAMVSLESFTDEAATVALRLDLVVAEPRSVAWKATFTPANFEGETMVQQGEATLPAGHFGLQLHLALSPYRLWWTHDLGFPHLYRVDVALSDPATGDLLTTWQGRTGLRAWEMKDFIAHLNGRRVYLKGSNYPPGDVYLATMTPERAALDMRLARDAHMNLIRIHAHVDHPVVYDAADEAGVLLWQDFPMQWLYARSVLPQALKQAQEMVRMLHHHPSIVIWCMHNEPLHVDDTSKEPFLRVLKTYWSLLFSWNRDVMGTQLVAAVGHLDPQRTIIRASGEIWLPGWLEGTDGHYYFGWYGSYGPKRGFDWWLKFFKRNVRFVTEFGAQSFPNLENAQKFLPEDLAGSDFDHLNKHHLLQWDLMLRWLKPKAHTLAELVPASQAYQADIHRYYVDRLRHLKYKPNGGFLNFMFTDSHPGVSWSIVDHWRSPKASYHAYKACLAPQYAYCLTPKDQYAQGKRYELPCHLVNDAHRAVPAKLEAYVEGPSGERLLGQELSLTLAPDALPVAGPKLSFQPSQSGTHRLVLRLEAEGAEPLENVYLLPVA